MSGNRTKAEQEVLSWTKDVDLSGKTTAYFKEAFGGTVSDDKCCKLTVGDHPVIYYKTTVDVDDVRAYVIACYIYSGDMLTMFTAQLYDAESFEAWNSAINEMTISGEQLGSAMTAE